MSKMIGQIKKEMIVAEREYLNEKEQYKKSLNNEELTKIEDYELREIRQKYWGLRHRAFLDEHGIPDQDLGKVWDKLSEQERKEIEEYRLKKGITGPLEW
ncbi:hypothetical protein [Anaerosinus massiliensis]|uniref:hypothetical protein n=1 Tax=Massilibacillus massiliensis TaxID=1806837 RepID=UPI0018FE9EFC|nr:hypothetical protein [Massilibacillus massiliensis]